MQRKSVSQTQPNKKMTANKLSASIPESHSHLDMSNPDDVIYLQRTVGNQAVIDMIQTPSDHNDTPPLQRKTLTDHDEKVAYGRVLNACDSKSTTPGESNKIAHDGIPGTLGGQVTTVVDLVKGVNSKLMDGTYTSVWDDTDIAGSLRSLHMNNDGWLPALAQTSAQSPDPIQSAWAAAYDDTSSQYIELTVDSSWRVVFDMITHKFYVTLHYDNNGVNSPFFELT